MKTDILKIAVSPTDSIRVALDKMSKNKPKETLLPAGIVLVLDKTKKLLGIATEGDIRRALSRGIPMETQVAKAMNRNPFLVEGPKTSLEIISLVVDKIRKENWHKDRLDKIIVVDKQRKILDLLSFYDLWQQSDTRFKHIGVVGLGYVGLTLGITLADLGFKVKGLDKNTVVANSIQKGTPPFFELGLESLLRDHLNKNFKVVSNFRGANNCDIYFISVGTPLNRENKPDLKYLGSAAEQLGKVLKYGDTVILRSTVPVGTTRDFVAPILEKSSGLKAGEGFFIAFAPERTIEGKALEELRHLPQVIGGFNHRSAELASSVFSFMTNATVLVDSLEEAEMVKLVNNTYRDVTFAFANEVALIAERWGIEAKKVIQAANYGYARSNVPHPSPGVGGYCLEKDPFIFIESAKAKGYDPLLFGHARTISASMLDFIANHTISFIKNNKPTNKNPKILTLGLAFKGRPVTSDIRGSTAVHLVKKLQKENYKNIYGFDPAVSKNDFYLHNVKYVRDLKAGFANADVVLVMTNHPSFEEVNIRQYLASAARPVLLFDTWGIFNKEEVMKIKGVHYKRL